HIWAASARSHSRPRWHKEIGDRRKTVTSPDFAAICEAFASRGYRFGAIVVDAALFVPQSRARLFIIGVKKDFDIPANLIAGEPVGGFRTKQLIAAKAKLDPEVSENWVWWKLPLPRARKTTFADLLENPEDSAAWHTPAETKVLLDMMSPINIAKVKKAQQSGELSVGCVYKRTRRDAQDGKVQRAEVRFDGISGCLRTPAGGSSRQVIVIVEGKKVRSRLITARETARLMGLKDSYKLPDGYNDAYHLTGDGVAVPVVRHIAKHILEPMVDAIEAAQSDLVDMMAEAA
ncbi:MAG: DNA cytosine methyltransferase, partial [Sphingomonadales bacterium]|nr:DNA cytosine methyltransferase [Sphingomonadales bacterium]